MTAKNDKTPDRKCYGQVCTVTTALDVAGDRWTFLIIRDLLGGPARFEDLVSGLPGIARNLLSGRLRRLEADGLIRRVDASVGSVYALTELGAGVRPALEELGFWGLQLERVAPILHARSIRAIAMALQAILSRAGEALPDQRVLLELDVDGEPIEVVLGPDPTATARLSSNPDARIAVPRATMSELLIGRPFEDEAFEVVSGESDLARVLVGALRAPFAALAGS